MNRSTISISTPKTALIRNVNQHKLIRSIKIGVTIVGGTASLGVTLLAAANEAVAFSAAGATLSPFRFAVASSRIYCQR